MICPSNSWLRLRVPSSDEEAAAAEVAEAEQVRPRQRFAGCLKRIFARVMVATMGCLFSCFRVRDSNPSSGGGSASNPGVSAGAAIKKQRSSLSSLLVVSEEDNSRLAKLNEDHSSGIPKPEHGFDSKELKDEAKFLKACGTLAETPDEIRKASQKFKDSYLLEGQHERSEFKSWLTDSSTDKLNANDEPLTPSKDSESMFKGLVSSEHTPSSCMTGGQNAERVHSRLIKGNDIMSAGSINSSTGSSITNADAPPLTGTCKNKSVRFDCDSDMSSASSKCYSSEGFSSKQSGSSSSGGPWFSPYPTPLKLSDEMQTPGTVFPAYVDATGQGNTRIRCQYVHPMESFPELKEMQDDGSYPDNQNNRSGEYFEQTDEESPTLEVDTDKSSGEKNSKFEASLSPWLRRDPLIKDNGHEELNGSTSARKIRPAVTPGDRPILGMVAAHWNDEEPTQNSPKWWGMNGIPNSTNKYKEDQKVSWHATPFEERLEKALSDETIISQRNQFSGTPPPDFSEAEEYDTAVSQLQPSNHFKTVVSI